jgi:branched-chain amino acid transport system permease protein/neutral amino acid transport system permease protein
MALFLRNLVQAIWGVGNRSYAMRIRPPHFVDLGLFEIRITTIQVVTVIVAVVLVTLLHFFLKYTKTGKAMRAMADNMDLARVTGINTERMIRWTWAIGAGLAAISGVFMGINFGIITPNTGALVLLPLFAAVILGGIGSPYGAMLGALVIGIAQNVLVAPVTSVNSQYKPGIAFVLMIIMLLVRPQGLLGEEERQG